MDSGRYSPWSCHGVQRANIMKKIYVALRFPAVLPEGVFNYSSVKPAMQAFLTNRDFFC